MSPRWHRVLCTLITALPLHAATPAIGGGPAGGNIRALAIAPSNPNIIYAGSSVGGGLAATAFEQTQEGSVFKTTNGGQSWTAVSNGLPDAPVVFLSVDPTNPNTVYAAIAANGIFKTVDGGQSWVNTGLPSPFAQLIAVDPSNSSTVYAGTSSAEGWFISTNGGQSWSPGHCFSQPDCNPANSNFVSVGSLAFDPTNLQIRQRCM
jgi:Sortilin, neurotensin receptor 3,